MGIVHCFWHTLYACGYSVLLHIPGGKIVCISTGGSDLANFLDQTCGKTLEEVELLFSKNGPPAWRTKKGSEHIGQNTENVAAAQAKQEAHDRIETIAKKEKNETAKTEMV